MPVQSPAPVEPLKTSAIWPPKFAGRRAVPAQNCASVGAGLAGSAGGSNCAGVDDRSVRFARAAPRPVLDHHEPVVGQGGRRAVDDDRLAANWSIDAATEITPRALAGVPVMYAEPPTGWLPALPAEATNTVPRSTTRCAATASTEFRVP